jgi:hypothetical protein
MYKFFAPELSAQFMTAPTGRPKVIRNLLPEAKKKGKFNDPYFNKTKRNKIINYFKIQYLPPPRPIKKLFSDCNIIIKIVKSIRMQKR